MSLASIRGWPVGIAGWVLLGYVMLMLGRLGPGNAWPYAIGLAGILIATVCFRTSRALEWVGVAFGMLVGKTLLVLIRYGMAHADRRSLVAWLVLLADLLVTIPLLFRTHRMLLERETPPPPSWSRPTGSRS